MKILRTVDIAATSLMNTFCVCMYSAWVAQPTIKATQHIPNIATSKKRKPTEDKKNKKIETKEEKMLRRLHLTVKVTNPDVNM